MTPPRPAPTADAVLAECAGWRALVDLLIAEQEALRTADTPRIELLARRKAEHVGNLDAQAQAREARMRAHGYPINGTGLELWFAQALDPAEAHARRNEITTLAQTARRLNRQNGALVARLQRYVQSAFAALALAAGAELTYDGSGMARPFARKRTAFAV